MNTTRSALTESVDYRRSVRQHPTPVRVLRVTFTNPLISTEHEDFTSEIDASTHVLMLMRVLTSNRRGSVTVQAL
jgi:hypothetical protein